jgi:UDP-N-acetyl-2-amino-2-deoxyglucuronate dehydrogenase
MAHSYRVAIVGCGGISRRHARGFAEHPACTLVAGADIRAENVEKLAAEFGFGGKYTDTQEMLERERPEIVAICTWPGTHAEFTVAAAERGAKGILCEKPMCLSLGEADRMLESCARTGTKLAIGHHGRFERPNVTARELIREGAIGQPTLLRARASDGLLNNGTHAIDRMRFVLGDPAALWVFGQVERRTDRWERAHPIEDRCTGLIAFDGGARGVLEVDTPEAGAPGGYFVSGTEGTLRWGRDGLRLLSGTGTGWQEAELRPTKSQHEEFIDWLEGRGENRTEGAQARATMELMMAIYESARTKGLVELPLRTKESPLKLMIDDGTLPVEKPGKYDIRI